MKLSHVLAAGVLTVAAGGASLGTALAVDSNPAPEKPAVTAKAETPKETPKTDKVQTAKGEPLVQDEKPTAEAPKAETPTAEKGEALVQPEKPAFPEEKIKELKAEQDKAEADAKAKEDKKAGDKEKTPAKDTAKKPLPKTSAVK